jgi:hypothetical protein
MELAISVVLTRKKGNVHTSDHWGKGVYTLKGESDVYRPTQGASSVHVE